MWLANGKGGRVMDLDRQYIIDEAVKIATRRALNGKPIARIIWIPPQTASSSSMGSFYVQECPPLSAGDTAPWEK